MTGLYMSFTIFRKDVRRLWWAIAATLALLAALAHVDRWRADWLAGSTEGWLNILLPLAWACLLGLVVQQEPLVGDRQFWLTWPYRRSSLLASKVLFAIAFIHVPLLLAGAAILHLHGFHVYRCLPQLFYQQLLLAACFTAPVLALALLFGNTGQFLFAAILLGSTAVYLAGSSGRMHVPWVPPNEVRLGLSILVLGLAAAAVIALQYASRRVRAARTVGVSAAVTAGLLFGYLPSTFTTRARALIHPLDGRISIQLATSGHEAPPPVPGSRNRSAFVVIALPVAISGIASAPATQFDELTVDLAAPGGRHYRTGTPSGRGGFEKFDLHAYPYPVGAMPKWLVLQLRRSIFDDIKDSAVELQGLAAVSFHRLGETAWMPVGVTQDVPGVGRCSSTLVEPQSSYQQSMLKVLCESPSPVSPQTSVRLWQPETGSEWTHRLGDAAPDVAGPRETWLSPLHRQQTYFQLASGMPNQGAGSRWLVPQEAVPTAKLAITPNVVTAWAAVDFDLPDIRLRDYEIKPAR
ncbi:MAG TPA: hypothetical protein VMZ52_18615 [Bryobacteraceae bacterium]|nr:hypothetical protein [Bryobacteraceae bacterium]